MLIVIPATEPVSKSRLIVGERVFAGLPITDSVRPSENRAN